MPSRRKVTAEAGEVIVDRDDSSTEQEPAAKATKLCLLSGCEGDDRSRQDEMDILEAAEEEEKDFNIVRKKKKKRSKRSKDDTRDEDAKEAIIQESRPKSDEPPRIIDKVSPNKPLRIDYGKVNISPLVRDLKVLASDLIGVIFEKGEIDPELAKRVMNISGEYEQIIYKFIAENERLKGRLEILDFSKNNCSVSVPLQPIRGTNTDQSVQAVKQKALSFADVAAGAVKAPAVSNTSAPATDTIAPISTWSLVVKSKEAGEASDKVAEKILKHVAPALDVRVKEIRPLQNGAIIRTLSIPEQKKIAPSCKFEEDGLEVAVNKKPGERIDVQEVPTSCHRTE